MPQNARWTSNNQIWAAKCEKWIENRKLYEKIVFQLNIQWN